jgi:sigma-B regulation protein RsbQ
MEALKRNNVQIYGKGKPLIFAHGYGLDQKMWKHITPAFMETHQIILFDHVGSGLSDINSYNKTKYNSLHGYAADLIEICETLKLEKPIFIGHSVSAMIGILTAIQKPDIFEKLILIGPSACYLNRDDYVGGFNQEDIEGLLESIDDNYLGWAKKMAPALMNNPNRPMLAEELAATFCKVDPVIAAHFARVTFLTDNRAHMNKIKVPTLILQAADDLVAPATVGQFIQDNISNSVLIKMKATGHFPSMSAPEETILAIKSFV